ncbi:MAG: hypothetical protein MUF14_05665 [Hyphomonadaceae bacterium]|nr:hypothetical protein [Hyphomonadaceae bacterium]
MLGAPQPSFPGEQNGAGIGVPGTPGGRIVWRLTVSGRTVRAYNENGYLVIPAGRPNEGSFGNVWPLYQHTDYRVDFFTGGGIQHQFRVNGVGVWQFTSSETAFLNSLNITPVIGNGSDVRLWRDAANILALRNGTNAQTFRVYETHTNASNGSWVNLRAASGRFELVAQANGTGVRRPVLVDHGTVTVSALPSAATVGAGARMCVSDATARTFGDVVAGGGSMACPVFSDGTNWRMG